MFRTIQRVALAAVAVSLLAACGHTVGRKGFIPSSVPLMEAKDDSDTMEYRAQGFALSQYGSVKVEAVEIGQIEELRGNPEEFEKMRARFQASLQAALEKSGGKGDRVLIVRGSITAFKPNKPLLNVAPQTQIMKRGYGYAACEIFATDGPGGKVVAAWMNTQDTQRFGTEKLSEFGTIEKACETWGPAFRAFLGK
jgi:outer membrane lipopolysaccharide assembly protein LptE/RlpB